MASRRWSILVATTVALALTVAVLAPGAASPGWIVFSAHPDGAAPQQLYRVGADGEGLQQITTGTLPAVSPAFARVGARLVFSRLGSGIFTVNVDGTALRRLTSNPRDSYPVFSPDGQRIAFLRLVKAQWRVFIMSASGQEQRRAPQAPPAGRPSWTPDGKAIIMPSGGDLVKIDPRTGHVLKYFGLAIDTQTGQTATVSPDARSVAYVNPRRSTGPPDCGDGRCPQFGLYLANVPSPHRARRIVDDTGAAGWSPDGKTLAFISKGALTLRVVATGMQTSISTGSHVADGDAPPAWQYR
jgi:Tol biopolymer transport system component